MGVVVVWGISGGGGSGELGKGKREIRVRKNKQTMGMDGWGWVSEEEITLGLQSDHACHPVRPQHLPGSASRLLPC